MFVSGGCPDGERAHRVKDALGFEVYARVLAQQLEHGSRMRPEHPTKPHSAKVTESLPLAVGIYAPWGAGKVRYMPHACAASPCSAAQ